MEFLELTQDKTCRINASVDAPATAQGGLIPKSITIRLDKKIDSDPSK